MKHEEFLYKISKRMSFDCGLPVNVNEQTINGYIDECSEFFYEKYPDALESKYLIISLENFNSDTFKSERQILLPDCIHSIADLTETNQNSGAGIYNDINPDYRKLNITMANGGRLGVLGNKDAMLYRLVDASYADFINSNFVLKTISFDFNRYTHRLVIKGRDPKTDLVADVYVKIPIENLYDSVFFFKYLLAHLYRQVDLVLSFVEINAIGGNRLNTSKLERISDTYMKEVEDEIEDANDGSDFFFMV